MKKLLITALIAGMGGLAQAATVAPSGGDFTTIQGALDGSADLEIVVSPGSYDEVITITRPVTIRGSDPGNRPIILAQNNTTIAITGGDGIIMEVDGAVTLQDLIVIPSATSTPADDAIVGRAPSTSGILSVTLENVLITANDGTGQPLQTTFEENPDLGAAGLVFFPDDPIYFMTRAAFGGNTGRINTVFTNVQCLNWTNGTGADIIVYPDELSQGGTTNVWTGVEVVGGNDGTQISAATASDFTITDWKARDGSGIGMTQFQGNNVSIDGLIIDNYGLFGIRADFDTITQFDMTNALITNCGAEGFWTSFDAGTPKTWTITNSTFYGNGTTDPGADPAFANIKFEAATTANCTLEITDCIIAGPTSGFENLGAGTINVSNSALVTTGPFALAQVRRGTAGDTGTVTETAVINDDPNFNSITRPNDTDSANSSTYDVNLTAGNAYETADSLGGVLTGWGDFLLLTAAEHWMSYE